MNGHIDDVALDERMILHLDAAEKDISLIRQQDLLNQAKKRRFS
ncbi:hypothetical protein CHCC5025_0848 [Bacillus licheniformis]|nr:hypothetical protein CHCC5025_0848 [Bacillus licheniformis]